MRPERRWLAVFLLAAGIGGAWVMSDTPEAAETVRVEAPAPGPADGAPAPVNSEDVIRQAMAAVTGQQLCEAPPAEVTEDLQRAVEDALSKVPVPTVPPDTPGGVINIHRRLVPC